MGYDSYQFVSQFILEIFYSLKVRELMISETFVCELTIKSVFFALFAF